MMASKPGLFRSGWGLAMAVLLYGLLVIAFVLVANAVQGQENVDICPFGADNCQLRIPNTIHPDIILKASLFEMHQKFCSMDTLCDSLPTPASFGDSIMPISLTGSFSYSTYIKPPQPLKANTRYRVIWHKFVPLTTKKVGYIDCSHRDFRLFPSDLSQCDTIWIIDTLGFRPTEIEYREVK